MSQRVRTWCIATGTAVVVGAAVGLALRPEGGPGDVVLDAPRAPPPTSDTVSADPHAAAADAGDLRREAYRDKVRCSGMFPFRGLTYAADGRFGDSRWAQIDGPPGDPDAPQVTEFLARWTAQPAREAEIEVQVVRYLQRSLDGSSTYSLPFDGVDVRTATADLHGMAAGFHRTAARTLAEVLESESRAPRPCRVGPAQVVASVVGTDRATGEPVRRDVYGWLGPNATWIAFVTWRAGALRSPELAAKGVSFVRSIRELRPPR